MFKGLLSIALTVCWGSTFAFAADSDTAKLYGAKCANCHGKDGTGTAKMAKMLKVDQSKLDLTSDAAAKATDEDLIKITTGGQKKMPKFKDKLKDEDIAGLVKYIRTLAPSKK